MQEIDKVLFKDRINDIESSFIKDGWITIYESSGGEDFNQSLIYSCIVNSKKIKSYRIHRDWEISPEIEGKPSIWLKSIGEKQINKYQSFDQKGIEPFIFSKSFKFEKGYERYIDISEEFVLYFKLYERGENKQNRTFYYIDDSGDLNEVIKIVQNKVTIKLKYIKEYLDIRKCYLSVCFDFMRFSKYSIDELEVIPIDKDFSSKKYFYNHYLRPFYFIEGMKIQSWIHGKVIVGWENRDSKKFHFSIGDEQYEKFITGYDDFGNEIFQDCRKTNEKYFVVTYFKKEVLDKYYNDPSKYNVDDMHLSSDFFSLKIDNNIEDYVAVLLIELGYLPYKEQLHWKQYNIAPQKGLSSTYVKTFFEGNWAQKPETADLFFKNKYNEFNKHWKNKFGWEFYKPLAKENNHRFTALHIPTTNNIKVFCEQILSLVILTIDSLNEEELQREIILEENDKGISKLKKYLLSKGIEMPDMISFLRNLQDLRSGLLAHRFSKSSKNSIRAIKYFGIMEDNYITVAKDIFIKSINSMNTLEKVFKLVDK